LQQVPTAVKMVVQISRLQEDSRTIGNISEVIGIAADRIGEVSGVTI
jgi:Flp pilus assembly CpaF family ATPase